MILKFKKLTDDAKIPTFAHKTDAGMDISSIENVTIGAGKFMTVCTGLAVDIPKGYELQIRSRSGLASKSGIFVLNGIATIDAGYRGELKIILANFSDKDFEIAKGDRIAQIVVSKLLNVKTKVVDKFDGTTKRGTGGFGSTGKF